MGIELATKAFQMSSLYVKTAMGIAEVEHRNNGISARQRKLLILIDGKRDAEDLAAMFPGGDAPAILASLLDEGYVKLLTPGALPVEPKVVTPQLITPKPAAPRVMTGNEVERYAQARHFMISTTRAHIGLDSPNLTNQLGASVSLINHLETCADMDALREQLNPWREVIKLSSEGRKDMAELEKQLALLLA
jgi:hypothetical protein